jgi:transposase
MAGMANFYKPERKPGPIIEAACSAHSQRKLFELAEIEAAARRKAQGKKPQAVYPFALEVVRRIDELFAIERDIYGQSAEQRLAVRQRHSTPVVADLQAWMLQNSPNLSPGHDVAKAMNYMIKRWDAFSRFLPDGRICLSNNAAEHALRLARHHSGAQVMAVLWLRPRRPARRGHVQPHHHRQAQ